MNVRMLDECLFYPIITKFGHQKLCETWVPKVITDQHKEQRMWSIFFNRSRKMKIMCFQHWDGRRNVDFLHQCKMETMAPLRFANTEKSWIYSSRRMMAVVYWDKKDVILVDHMELRSKITADVFCQTVAKLRGGIQSRRRGKQWFNLILLQVTTSAQTAGDWKFLLETFLIIPLYSPELCK